MIWRVIFGAAVLGLVIGLVLFYRSVAAGIRGVGDVPAYSVQRYDPYGTAALRDLLSERGIEVRTLDRPMIDFSDQGVLIQVLPTDQPRDGRGRYRIPNAQLANWLAAGNTVIQLCRAQTPLMTHLKVATTQPVGDFNLSEEHEIQGRLPSQTPARVVRAVTVGGGPPLLLWSPRVLPSQEMSAWKPLAHLPGEPQRVVAAELSLSGGGRVVWVGAPTPVLNGTIGEAGNLDFLLAQIGTGPVIFDEWSHGIGREATIVGFLHEVGLVPLLLQVGVIAGLYVWSTSGYAREDRSSPPRQRSSIEQIQTLGYLYNRSFDPDVTYERVHAEVQARLAEALRCQPQEIAAKAAGLNPELRAGIEQLWAQLSRLSPEHGPRCLGCGYDLYLCVSDRCPECGTILAPDMLRRLRDASLGPAPGGQRRQRTDSAFAGVLTLSHQLTREVRRDRRAL